MTFFKLEDWTALDNERFKVKTGKFQRSNDEIVTRHWIEPGNCVAVLPYNTKYFYMAQQPREITGRDAISLCAGRIDLGEAPIFAAKRELREELGLKSDFWTQLRTVYSSEGITNEQTTFFFAQDPKFDPLADIDVSEQVTLRIFSLDYLDVVIANTDNAKALIGLQALRLKLLKEQLISAANQQRPEPLEWPPEQGWGLL